MEQRNPPLIHNRLWRQRSLTFAASSGLREVTTLQPNYRTLRETILSLLVTVLGHNWDQEDLIRRFCCWSSGNILLVFWESVQSFFFWHQVLLWTHVTGTHRWRPAQRGGAEGEDSGPLDKRALQNWWGKLFVAAAFITVATKLRVCFCGMDP